MSEFVDFSYTRVKIEEFLTANFNSLPVELENITFIGDNEEHIKVSDDIVDSALGGVSDNMSITKGNLQILISTALGKGTSKSRAIASEIATLLLSASVDNIEFTSAILLSVPTDKKSIMYQQRLILPYTFIYGSMSGGC